MAGVEVTLFRADGTQLATTATDADGFYLFEGLKPGSYFVGFDKPAGYTFTTYDVNGNSQDGVDSDAQLPGLTLSLQTPDAEVKLGDRLTYTLDYGNVDALREAVNVVLSTTVPAGTTFLPEASTPGWGCEANATTAGTRCTFGVTELAANSQATAQFVVLLGKDDAQVPDAITFDVSISQGTPARTLPVTLVGGQENLTLDAGIHPESVFMAETPRRPGPTSLDETDQPDAAPTKLFLPSIQTAGRAADRTQTPAAPPAAEPPAETETVGSVHVFLPSMHN